MTTGRGGRIPDDARRAISAPVERMLLARSGGHCAQPACRADLFPDVPGRHVASLGELAHIIAQSNRGPRADPTVPRTARDAYDNIVLLCPTCHRLVDTMELNDIYDAELLREWKRDQERRIRDAVDVPDFASRDALFDEVGRLLRENHAVFARYGPGSPAAAQPGNAEAARVWRDAARRIIVPNNWRIARLLEHHQRFLSADERELAAEFSVHSDAFARNQLSGELDPNAPRFPERMADTFVVG